MTWNANGLNQRAQELEVFLRQHNIDIALISETHFSNKNFIKFKNYCTYWTTHPSERARGGSAVLIKQNIKHYLKDEIREQYIQATIVCIQHSGAELNIGAVYCPPGQTISRMQYLDIFNKLGPKFILGGDFNVKHTAWGSRLITPIKGNVLLSAINEGKCGFHSSGKPTYWPTDNKKVPDLIDFFISKGIKSNCATTEGIDDLSSDHTPVLLSLSATVIKKIKKQNLTTKRTNWETFREHLDELIDLNVKLSNKEELECAFQNFINLLQLAAREATPIPSEKPEYEINYPAEIRELIKERRKLRRIWHSSRHPNDKKKFNEVSNLVNRLIKEFKQSCIDEYLNGLGTGADKEYSLWKATRRFKRPMIQVPPIKNALGQWVRKDEEKAELFAQHLSNVFQPHEITSNINPTPAYLPEGMMKPITPYEAAQEIDKNLNPKKSPGIDEISPGLLKELTGKAVKMLTYLFNACLRLKYVPKSFKTAQIIMINKPDKPVEQVTSYRPISLLSAISKLFEKLLLKRLKPLINIPDFQFGFRNKHSTIDQVHRVVTEIEKAFEAKKYCVAVFLDVSQAFDKVWHEGLIYKMSKLLPGNFCQLLESYLTDREFRVMHEGAFSGFYQIKAGVPQGSVLGPFLYLLYTADIPTTDETFMGTFADDTTMMATGDTQVEATQKLQHAVDKVSQWNTDWKIKLNEIKSIHVTYALRTTSSNHQIYLNGTPIPQADSAKLLGMHLDKRLSWKHHVKRKAKQIKLKTRQMYWMVGHHSQLNLHNKRLIYQTIIKPIWTYGIQLWGCTKKTNRDIIQKSQNKFLRMITNAYRFETNEDIHNDLNIKWVQEVIQDYASKHEKRLLNHTNIEAIRLLDITHELRRLKRTKPHELT